MATYDEWQQALHSELKGFLAAIASGSDDIADRVRAIDRLTQEMSDQTHPMLRHYLERRSYAKALDFLEGRHESVTANC